MEAYNRGEAAIRALRQRVYDDPALQVRLFALDDSADFIAALQRLASSIGYSLDGDDISQVMAVADRAWFERALP